MRRMILACAVSGTALLFGSAPTPGLAGDASLQFVGYKHGGLYCQYRECAGYYNCGYYKRCCSYYQYYDCAPYHGGGGYYKKRYYGGGGSY